MTFVFGTSLRPDSEPLAEIGARLAHSAGEPLRLVHVCEDPRAPLVLGTDQEPLIGPVRQELTAQAERLRGATGAAVQPHLLSGPIVGALASVSEFELATALLVGPTTRRIRYTADRLSAASRVPVFTLRDPERLGSWLRGQRPLRVMVGADLGRTARAARAFAARLAALGGVEVELACAVSPQDVHRRLGLEEPAGAKLSAQAEASLRRELADAAPEGEASATVWLLVGRGRADAQLVARADEGDFDLVIVGQRRGSVVQQIWQASIGRGVLQAAPVSVVTVPEPIAARATPPRRPRVVVVGADCSEADGSALAYAVAYAEEGGTVHLVHVLAAEDPVSGARRAREERWYRLTKTQRDVPTERSVSVQPHVLEGSPAEQLLAFSERVGAGLVVLGVRGASTDRMLPGTTRRALIRDSRFPVLLVPNSRP